MLVGPSLKVVLIFTDSEKQGTEPGPDRRRAAPILLLWAPTPPPFRTGKTMTCSPAFRKINQMYPGLSGGQVKDGLYNSSVWAVLVRWATENSPEEASFTAAVMPGRYPGRRSDCAGRAWKSLELKQSGKDLERGGTGFIMAGRLNRFLSILLVKTRLYNYWSDSCEPHFLFADPLLLCFSC